MATSYKALAEGVINKIKSLGLPGITEDMAFEVMYPYLRPACVRFKASKQDLSDRDDDSKTFNVDLTEEEIEIITHLMLVEYITTTYINVPSLLRQNLTSVDFRVFSSKNHLDGLISLRDTYKNEAKQMISIYSNQDSKLFDTLKIK